MAYWAKDGSFVREDSDDTPRMTQGDEWEAQQRVIKGMQDWERKEEKRKAAEKQDRIDYYETRRMVEEQRSDTFSYEHNKNKAVRLIVEQKRQEYKNKSWFKKLDAKLRGKSFAQNKINIEANAWERVDKMSPEYLERFIEEQTEGRSR